MHSRPINEVLLHPSGEFSILFFHDFILIQNAQFAHTKSTCICLIRRKKSVKILEDFDVIIRN